MASTKIKGNAKKKTHDKIGHNEVKNYPRVKLGKKYGFKCLTSIDGRHYIGCYNGDIAFINMGISYLVHQAQADSDSDRDKIEITGSDFILHEIKVGDYITKLERYKEDGLYASGYKVCNIYTDVAIGVGVGDEFFYGEKQDNEAKNKN